MTNHSSFPHLGALWCCLLLALAALVPSVRGAAHAGEPGAATARFVADGDTLVLADGRTVRLVGLDAPETSHDGAPAQYGADLAARRLRELALGQVLTVVPSPKGRDHYGRLLAELLLPGGASVNETLVREGLAFVYTHADEPPGLRGRLLAAQREALAAGRGLWPRVLAVPGADAPWVGNRNSWRAFPAGSREAGRLAARNRVPLANLRQVFEQGFSPARQVSPWP